MLKVFRENLKKLFWILWIVIAAFVLLVFVDFGGAGPQGPSDTVTAATVGGESISVQEFRRQYESNERQMQERLGQSYTPEIARQLGLAQRALDTLVAQRIMLREARRMGLEASETEVRKAILQQPGFQDENGGFIGAERYTRLLRSNNYTVAAFEAEIHDQLLLDKFRVVLANTAWVSDQETEEAYRDKVERAKLRYVLVPSDRFRDAVHPEPGDLEEYFDAHAADFTVPEQRVVDYLLIEPALLAAGVEVGDDEVQAYYDANQDEFTQDEEVRARHILLKASDDAGIAAARQKLEGLRKRIEAGESFGDLARQYSEDDSTRGRGGELGYFPRGRYNPALEAAAFDGEVGELVGPFESDLITETGVHLLEVLDHRKAGVQPLDEVAPLIRSRLVSARAQDAARDLARQLHDRIEADGITDAPGLETLAGEFEAASFHTTAPFGRNDNVPGIGRGTPFTLTAFATAQGTVAAPVELARGFAVLRVAEVREPRVPELAEVEDAVRAKVVDFEADEAARAALAQAAARLRQGTTLDDLAAELGVEPVETPEFGRAGTIGDLGAQPAVAAAAFAAGVGDVIGPVAVQRGQLVATVTERTEWDPVAFDQAKEETRQGVARERVEAMLVSLIDKRREELGVQYNRQLLDSLGVFADEASS